MTTAGDEPDVVLVSRQGVVIEASQPDRVGLNVHDQAWFRSALHHARKDDPSAVIDVQVDGSMQDWRVRVARWLGHPDGRFGGVLMAEERLPALDTLFGQVPASPQAAAAFGPHTALKLQAAVISVLILLLAGVAFAWTEKARRSAQDTPDDDVPAPVDEEMLLVRARAAAVAAQWNAVVTGMSDGVVLLDPQLRLLEWNRHFPELASVPAHLLHPGTTMEQILLAQAAAG